MKGMKRKLVGCHVQLSPVHRRTGNCCHTEPVQTFTARSSQPAAVNTFTSPVAGAASRRYRARPRPTSVRRRSVRHACHASSDAAVVKSWSSCCSLKFSACAIARTVGLWRLNSCASCHAMRASWSVAGSLISASICESSPARCSAARAWGASHALHTSTHSAPVHRLTWTGTHSAPVHRLNADSWEAANASFRSTAPAAPLSHVSELPRIMRGKSISKRGAAMAYPWAMRSCPRTEPVDVVLHCVNSMRQASFAISGRPSCAQS